MDTHLIERISFKDAKTDKRGRTYTPVGICIKGTWYNNIIYNQDELDQLKEGTEVELTLFQEQGTGDYADRTFNKFKFPTAFDLLERRVDILEQHAGIKDIEPDKASEPTDLPETPPTEEPPDDGLPF